MDAVNYKGLLLKVGDLVKSRCQSRRYGHVVRLVPIGWERGLCKGYVVADVVWQDGEKLSFSLNYLELVNE